MRFRSATPRSFVVILLATSAVFLSSCGALVSDTVFSPPGTTTTIVLVRHAERDPGLDPPLNAEGVIRAAALGDALEDEGVTAVFYPDLLRNRQTAEPLVERFNPTIRVFTQIEVAVTKTLANTIVDEVVRDHAGGVVVWIGNTGPFIEGVQEGNLQELYARLGGTGSPPTQYQSLYRVVLTENAPPAITPGNYGGVSSLD
jgi:hypothetical protein